MFHRFALFLLSFVFLASCLASQCQAQAKSTAAGVFLRATLAQSLSMSVLPHGVPSIGLVSSRARQEFPLTIKANWVRGAGNVSVAVFFSDGLLRQRSEPRPIAANAPADLAHSASLPGLSLESAELPRPEPGKDEVLTIRAQVI